MQSEYEIIKSKVEEYKVRDPLVVRNIELEKELDETNERCIQQDQDNKDLKRKLSKRISM